MGKDQKTQNRSGGRRTSSSRKGNGSGLLREFSAGGVVFRKEKDKILWLVCKSNPSPEYPGDYWRLPKGWIDDIEGRLRPGPISSGQVKATEEDLVTTALREVQEEGGVDGEIITKIGNVRYFTRRGLKFVTYYLMKWARDLPEGFNFETERIEWLHFDEASERLNNKTEKEVLKKANLILGSGTQESLI